MTRAGTSTRAIVVAILAALTLGGATASAASPAQAGARLAACRHAPVADQRVAVASAWMKPLPAARHLSLKLDLYQRALPSGRWTLRTDVPGLGTWTAPSDALVGTRAGDVFKYRQAVGRLLLGYAYRFRVAFRWLDDAGAVVRESALTTRACRQPDGRPDLVLSAVRAEAAGDGLARYAVTVANAGRSPARGVAVGATLPGETTPLGRVRQVGRLAPGASAVVTFTGPGCLAGQAPAAFAADPANAVDEANEANNQLLASCPAP